MLTFCMQLNRLIDGCFYSLTFQAELLISCSWFAEIRYCKFFQICVILETLNTKPSSSLDFFHCANFDGSH